MLNAVKFAAAPVPPAFILKNVPAFQFVSVSSKNEPLAELPLISNGVAPFVMLIDLFATLLVESLYLARPLTTPQSAFKQVIFAIKLKVVLAVIAVLFTGRLMLTYKTPNTGETTISVEFCLTLSFVSVAYMVKLIKHPLQVIAVTLCMLALVPLIV